MSNRIEGTGWFAAPNWIFDLDLRHTDKLVFLYLCRRAGSDGRSWPSVRRMADEVGVSRNTVRASIERLERVGLLRRERRISEAGDADSYVYYIARSEPAGVGQSVPHVGQSVTTQVGQTEAGVGQSRPHGVGQSVPHGGSIRAPEGLPIEGLPTQKDREEDQDIASGDPKTSSSSPLLPDLDSNSDSEPSDDLRAVTSHYRDAMGGLIGPMEFDKLRFWLEDMEMPADVVCAAIDQMKERARSPGIGYVEAVLRNWRRDGIRTLADVTARERADTSSGRVFGRGRTASTVSDDEFMEALREAGAI